MSYTAHKFTFSNEQAKKVREGRAIRLKHAQLVGDQTLFLTGEQLEKVKKAYSGGKGCQLQFGKEQCEHNIRSLGDGGVKIGGNFFTDGVSNLFSNSKAVVNGTQDNIVAAGKAAWNGDRNEFVKNIAEGSLKSANTDAGTKEGIATEDEYYNNPQFKFAMRGYVLNTLGGKEQDILDRNLYRIRERYDGQGETKVKEMQKKYLNIKRAKEAKLAAAPKPVNAGGSVGDEYLADPFLREIKKYVKDGDAYDQIVKKYTAYKAKKGSVGDELEKYSTRKIKDTASGYLNGLLESGKISKKAASIIGGAVKLRYGKGWMSRLHGLDIVKLAPSVKEIAKTAEKIDPNGVVLPTGKLKTASALVDKAGDTITSVGNSGLLGKGFKAAGY